MTGLPSKMVPNELRLLLSPRDAARAIDVSERTLWSLTKSGEIPALKIGRLTKYSVDDLREWVERKKAGDREQ